MHPEKRTRKPRRAQPLQHRTSPEVDSLVRRERFDAEYFRVVLGYLGVIELFTAMETMGPFRAALLWDRLPAFLDGEGWRVDACVGFDRHDSVAPATFGAVRLSERVTLEVPERAILFLRRGRERVVLRATLEEHRCGSPVVEVQAVSAGESSQVLERLLDFTRATNRLRGAAIAAGGRLLEPHLGSTARAFLRAEERARIDRAVARFAAAATSRLAALGVRARAGLILTGPPGTGKSTLGRELAASAPCTFLWATPGDLPSPDEVKELFALARWLSPTILFLEDLDLIAESRERGGRAMVLGQMMNELDGLQGDHPIFAVATTNRLEVIEEAVRSRPGRFDEVIELGMPDSELRAEMLRHFFRACRVEDRDLLWLAARLDGATGAEIERVAHEAIALAVLASPAAESSPAIAREHLESALAPRCAAPLRRAVGFGGD